MAARDADECHELLREIKESPGFMAISKEHFFRKAYNFTITGSILKEIEECY